VKWSGSRARSRRSRGRRWPREPWGFRYEPFAGVFIVRGRGCGKGGVGDGDEILLVCGEKGDEQRGLRATARPAREKGDLGGLMDVLLAGEGAKVPSPKQHKKAR